MRQYYENSKYISNLFFVMLHTYIFDDSIKINDDDQDSHSRIDGDAEDIDE